MASAWCACRDCSEVVSPENTWDQELCEECEVDDCELYQPANPAYADLPSRMRECQRKDAYEGCGGARPLSKWGRATGTESMVG